MTVLIWGLIRYEDAYTAAGELQHMRQTVKWGLDSLVKSHTDENEFYVQVGREGGRAGGREGGTDGGRRGRRARVDAKLRETVRLD